MLTTVTNRIKEVKQPRGGYLKPSELEIIEYDDGNTLNEKENVHPTLIGLAVDYMTRFMMGAKLMEVFDISMKGAANSGDDSLFIACALLNEIKGLDDKSINCACKLVSFDVWYRNPSVAYASKTFDEINPDKQTIENIRILIQRSIAFFEKYGPIIKDGFNFNPVKEDKKSLLNMMKTGQGTYGGYTATVISGDGDFLTSDTLWDFKVSINKPTSKHTLQLLMYWIMGQHSGQECFKNISKIGIFNPRLNTVYLFDMSKIDPNIIKIIEDEVICY